MEHIAARNIKFPSPCQQPATSVSPLKQPPHTTTHTQSTMDEEYDVMHRHSSVKTV